MFFYLSFSNSLSTSIIDADIIFITVGTPSKRIENEADLSSVWNVAEEISNNILTIKDLRSDRDDMSIGFDDFSKFIEEY